MAARKRILVIDDDAAVRESCERMLRTGGYDVESVASGIEGLQRSGRNSFDCVLVDLNMPDMDGMEVIRRVRRHKGDIPLVVITGYGDAKTAAEAARLGVSDYICKPFTQEKIIQAVRRAMEHSDGPVTLHAIGQLVNEIKASVPKPEDYEDRTPQAIAEMITTKVGVSKAQTSILNTLILGALAGVYIGFGAAIATLVGSDAVQRFGIGAGQILTGAVFSVGLILVVIAGAELFTGNNLMITSVLGKHYGWARMLSHWSGVYFANFIGAMLLVLIMYHSGLWKTASGAVGVKALAIANAKVNLSFSEAFFRGIGCNWLVCLAVWMALSAREIAGKVLVIVFPITAFVALGYEHCVANMYFIPMGLLLKGTAAAAGVGTTELASLTWTNFVTTNLAPVTLGNILGGGLFVGSAYWYTYMRDRKRAS